MKMNRRGFIKGSASFAGAALSGLHSQMIFGEDCPEKTVVSAGLVTDLHYANIDRKWTRFYRGSAEKLRAAVDTMNRLRPDFMIELGDFKDMTANKTETLACLDKIESVFSRFKGDRFHVPGNHDFDCLTPSEFFAHIRNTGQDTAKGYFSFVRGGITFIVLDACYTSKSIHYSGDVKWDWTDSNIPVAELEWLETELGKAKTAVVFCHQRLDDKARNHHGVKNASDVRAILERSGKVKSVLTGHDHAGGIARKNGIVYYTLRAMVEGEGAKSNSYAVASFYADGSMSVKGWYCAKNFPK